MDRAAVAQHYAQILRRVGSAIDRNQTAPALQPYSRHGKSRRNKMRIAITIATAALASLSLCSAALTAPAATRNPVAPVVDCRKSGNEVSALIDNKFGSPNLPAARAMFQIGVMECMEGDDVAANTHYEQAKALLDDRLAPETPAQTAAKN
jgi:hypothetical protein